MNQFKWATWPEWDQKTAGALTGVLDSGRWTVSWPSDGKMSKERAFAKEFAALAGAEYAVSVDHGSNAIVVGLLALGVGPGDEVIVPNMTWIASVSAILRVGASPVLCDVNAETGCIDWESVEPCLTDRTKGVLAVHLACAVADVQSIAERLPPGVFIAEDCAQAHGATVHGRGVGTIGSFGAFSFQQAKTLTAGEGGAVVFNDVGLYEHVQDLRADSRHYVSGSLQPGDSELDESGGMMGANFCMTEFQAAILLEQLERFDEQRARREANISELLSIIEPLGFGLPKLPGTSDRRSVYELAIKFDSDAIGQYTAESFAELLTAEIGFPVFSPDPPLSEHPLFSPQTNALYKDKVVVSEEAGRYLGTRGYMDTTLLLHHRCLLAPGSGKEIARGIRKVLSV